MIISTINWLESFGKSVLLHIVLFILFGAGIGTEAIRNNKYEAKPFEQRPIVEVELYRLESSSSATEQTSNNIAGGAKVNQAPLFESEQFAVQKQEQAAENARKREQEKKRIEEAKKKDRERQQAIEKRRMEQEKKQQERQQARREKEEAEKKRIEEAKKKAIEEAHRKAKESQRAAVEAELLANAVKRQQAIADNFSEVSVGSLNDLVTKKISENWRRPISARRGMSVDLVIKFKENGVVDNVEIIKSSGNKDFDNSATAAIKSIGKVEEIAKLEAAVYRRHFKEIYISFRPEN